jgi:hypothetical protein
LGDDAGSLRCIVVDLPVRIELKERFETAGLVANGAACREDRDDIVVDGRRRRAVVVRG